MSTDFSWIVEEIGGELIGSNGYRCCIANDDGDCLGLSIYASTGEADTGLTLGDSKEKINETLAYLAEESNIWELNQLFAFDGKSTGLADYIDTLLKSLPARLTAKEPAL